MNRFIQVEAGGAFSGFPELPALIGGQPVGDCGLGSIGVRDATSAGAVDCERCERLCGADLGNASDELVAGIFCDRDLLIVRGVSTGPSGGRGHKDDQIARVADEFG